MCTGRRFGSTNRKNGHWRVTYFSSTSGTIVDLTARSDGGPDVLEGVEPGGGLDRWVFSDITPDSFTWTGHESDDEGHTWPLVERMEVVAATDETRNKRDRGPRIPLKQDRRGPRSIGMIVALFRGS